MARIAQKQGLTMAKVFTIGQLQVRTGNPGYPLVQWGWHVAPIIDVRRDDGQVVKMVFDPSLFDRPVTIDEWNNRMLDAVPASEGGFTPRIQATFVTSRYRQFPGDTSPTHWTRDNLNNTFYTFERYRPLERVPPRRSPAPAAKSLPGYKRHIASTYLVYEGVPQNYFDEGANFFIQVDGQAGLYRFPKSADNADEVRKFLDDKMKRKKKIKIEVNANTAEIVTLSE